MVRQFSKIEVFPNFGFGSLAFILFFFLLFHCSSISLDYFHVRLGSLLEFGKRDVIVTSDGAIMKGSSFDVLRSIAIVFIAFAVMGRGVRNQPQ